MFFLYILKSVDYPKTYVGITSDIDRRITEHNNGYSTFTKKYKPWKLIYSEKYNSRSEARAREKFFKSTAGRRKMVEIIPW
jgi:putative endonuclease